MNFLKCCPLGDIIAIIDIQCDERPQSGLIVGSRRPGELAAVVMIVGRRRVGENA